MLTPQAEEKDLRSAIEDITRDFGDGTLKSDFQQTLLHPPSFEQSKRVFGQTAFLTISLVNLQDPILADETDPSTRSGLLYPGLDLSQYLPEFLETQLRSALDRHQVFLSDLTLCDRKERAGAVHGEVMVGCLGEVELGIRVVPVEVGGGDL